MTSRKKSGCPRVAIYSPIFSSRDGSHGGITSVIRGLLQGFGQKNLRILLLVRRDNRVTEVRDDLPLNARVHCIGRGSRRADEQALRGFLDQHRPDVLLTAGHRFNLVGIRAARASGVPVVASVHNHLSTQQAGKSLLHRHIRRREIRSIYPEADALVAVSDGVAADVSRWLGSRARVVAVPNPVAGDATDCNLRPDHPWLANERALPTVLAAGRLAPQKDYLTLLEAMARLKAIHSCRLIILGEGEERRALEERIHELGLSWHVDLPGFIPQIGPWLSAADAFVLSSAWEGFGNVLVEAISKGTPAVSTDCKSGPRLILQDGRVGPLVPVGASEALAEAIAGVLINPPPRDLLVRAAEPYRPERIASRYLEALGIPDAAV